jgi:hypothetical protein
MKRYVLLLIACFATSALLVGCTNSETTPPQTPTEASGKMGGNAPGAPKSGSSADTGVEAAPAGVKTDLSGGLK